MAEKKKKQAYVGAPLGNQNAKGSSGSLYKGLGIAAATGAGLYGGFKLSKAIAANPRKAVAIASGLGIGVGGSAGYLAGGAGARRKMRKSMGFHK
jgi:hypothetical protein